MTMTSCVCDIYVVLQAAVETQRKYKHVLWYSLFVAAYLIVLYLQASAYNSGEVVSTLRNALMPSESILYWPQPS